MDWPWHVSSPLRFRGRAEHVGLVAVFLSRQAGDLRPALHECVVPQGFAGAFGAFGDGVEAVGEFAGGFGHSAEVADECGGSLLATGVVYADQVVAA